MKIYTKGGDKGYTTLIGGRRVLKNHERIEAYGCLDELISVIGLLREMYENSHYHEFLVSVQDRLMVASSLLASESDVIKPELPVLHDSDILALEKEIDTMEEVLPPLRNFILPGGNKTVAVCHIARTTCRRAERLVIPLMENDPSAEMVVQYLNRLSDFLFVLSRYISRQTGAKEIPWLPGL